MASKTCVSCLRTLQRRAKINTNTRDRGSIRASYRGFVTIPPLYADVPKPNATVEAAQAPAGRSSTTASSIPTGIKAVAELRRVTGRATETYTVYGVTEKLYLDCARQADYQITQAVDQDVEVPKTEEGEDLGVGNSWWHNEMGLKPTFSTWSQVTMLHMYLLSARFRCFPSITSQAWQQQLLDHFFHDAETRMTVQHNMHGRSTRNKYLKDLFVQWRGLLAAYDEGVMKGDAALAAALWRNIFKASEDFDVKGLAQIVSYVRKSLKGLDKLTDDVVMFGEVEFGSPKGEKEVVALRSKMMDQPFQEPPPKDLPTRPQP